jgi:AmmeMemoRadiSam system protein A
VKAEEVTFRMMSDRDRAVLLRIARDAISAHVLSADPPVLDFTGALGRPAGAFVTLHKHGNLRGCVGRIETAAPLSRVVAECSVAAATEDSRFPAITPVEVSDLEIEISVLGPLEALSAPDDFEVGRHGLVVVDGWRRGLLLPQVAVERQWDRATFLAQTCHKAGLAPDALKHGAVAWRFEAAVFREHKGR